MTIINRHRLLKTAGFLRRRLRPDYDPKSGRSLLAGPRMVQIQTIDACNGSCACCPNARRDRNNQSRSMAVPVYLKLLDELRPVQSLKALVFMLQNEPLLDGDLAWRVREARMRFGKSVCISIVTNGELLSPDVVKGLYEAGLDHVEISLDALTRETYRRVRAGLDFDRVMENTCEAIAIGGVKKTTVRFLVQKDNVHEQKAFNAYWVRKGALVMFQDMTNRAGTLRRYRLLCPDRGPDWYDRLENFVLQGVPCVSGPFDRLNVLSDGRVLACCQDWCHDFLLGDLSSQRLTDIWTGPPAAFCRDMLWHGQFEKNTLCANCSLRLVFPGTTGKKR